MKQKTRYTLPPSERKVEMSRVRGAARQSTQDSKTWGVVNGQKATLNRGGGGMGRSQNRGGEAPIKGIVRDNAQVDESRALGRAKNVKE